MGYENRRKLIERIQQARKSKVICLVASPPPGPPDVARGDVQRVVIEHLLRTAEPVPGHARLDLFLRGDGGPGTDAGRLVSLVRESAKRFGVLIPYRASGEAALVTLGADEVVMHRFGELGPFPATGWSGEPCNFSDSKKELPGATRPDELARDLLAALRKARPPGPGDAERCLTVVRLLAGRATRRRGGRPGRTSTAAVAEGVLTVLCRPGGTAGPAEAKQTFDVDVREPSPELASLLWELNEDFEEEFRAAEAFDPLARLSAFSAEEDWPRGLRDYLLGALRPDEQAARDGRLVAADGPRPDSPQQGVVAMRQALQALNWLKQLVQQPAALMYPDYARQAADYIDGTAAQLHRELEALQNAAPTAGQAASPARRAEESNRDFTRFIEAVRAAAPPETRETIPRVLIESGGLASRLDVTYRFRLASPAPAGDGPPQPAVVRDTVATGWTHTPALAQPQGVAAGDAADRSAASPAADRR